MSDTKTGASVTQAGSMSFSGFSDPQNPRQGSPPGGGRFPMPSDLNLPPAPGLGGPVPQPAAPLPPNVAAVPAAPVGNVGSSSLGTSRAPAGSSPPRAPFGFPPGVGPLPGFPTGHPGAIPGWVDGVAWNPAGVFGSAPGRQFGGTAPTRDPTQGDATVQAPAAGAAQPRGTSPPTSRPGFPGAPPGGYPGAYGMGQGVFPPGFNPQQTAQQGQAQQTPAANPCWGWGPPTQPFGGMSGRGPPPGMPGMPGMQGMQGMPGMPPGAGMGGFMNRSPTRWPSPQARAAPDQPGPMGGIGFNFPPGQGKGGSPGRWGGATKEISPAAQPFEGLPRGPPSGVAPMPTSFLSNYIPSDKPAAPATGGLSPSASATGTKAAVPGGAAPSKVSSLGPISSLGPMAPTPAE